MRLRTVFVEWPARIVDVVWTLYLVLVIALTIACFTGVAITLAAYWLGFPLP